MMVIFASNNVQHIMTLVPNSALRFALDVG